jgi:uncharacterized protein (DUF1330 family)
VPAYIVAQVEELMDMDGLQQYIQQVIPLMERFGGRYIISSFAVEVLEGDGPALAVAVSEFPSIEQLQAFWGSPDYVPLLALRNRSARVRLLAANAPPTGIDEGSNAAGLSG